MAHGTIYNTAHPNFSPFIAFDIIRDGKRILRDEFVDRCEEAEIPIAYLVHDGAEAISIESALENLGLYGRHGSSEPVEGAVWRVEREGRVDFLAKYVRQDKVDGKYLPGTQHYDGDPIWLWKDAA